jgi:hypothetical protein
VLHNANPGEVPLSIEDSTAAPAEDLVTLKPQLLDHLLGIRPYGVIPVYQGSVYIKEYYHNNNIT